MALLAIRSFRIREVGVVTRAAELASQKPQPKVPKIPNPFLAQRNPDTGRWAPAKYSLRQQAELIKKARECNMLHLLPPGPKLPLVQWQKLGQEIWDENEAKKSSDENASEWKRQVVWEGTMKEKKVPEDALLNRLYASRKRMFKGHKWERMKDDREKKINMLMKDMPKRIQRFKATYRRRKPSPLSRPLATTKSAKLPF
ncbi:hypothetical protein NLI96_g4812 [Meripilus lineatus]|uniref:Large ribosomal subunit protein mL59 domain-containing protein n=1 Tax=Meripilus lineatus TaxID=2056292 RepID=A0AAD5V410_9APHY|nr:hypothetical protein NLI96_g4812 [Physisporinus lineatus]